MDSVFAIFLVLMAAVFYFYSPLGREVVDLQQASIYQTEEDLPQVQEEVIPQNQTQEEQSFWVPEPQKTTIPPQATEPIKPSFYINTSITGGPKEGEIIEETNVVTFEFKSKTAQEAEERIYFETKIGGFDNNWVKTYSQQRKVTLPIAWKEYTFFVRARTKDFVDPTPASRTFQIKLSPYFKKVRISQVKTSSQPSLITLTTYLSKGEKINITNWTLEGEEGKVTIPKAVEKYYHYYNSPGPEDIFIKQGSRIYLSAGFNPLGRDKNFRVNKCMGYLTNSFSFPIPFSRNCPKPTREEISNLDPCCQQFILSLSRCEIPDYSENKNVSGDSECTSYIDQNFNNLGCFRNHSEDNDFLENVWHIYLNGKDITVTNNCDIIYLRDQNDLVVATYSYGRAICK